MKPGELGFTYCQVPVRYRLADRNAVTVFGADGVKHHISELSLDPGISRAIFGRTGQVTRIEVDLSPPKRSARR